MHVALPEKLYYSIGEVAKAFNVNASLLRFWEKEFSEIKPKKNAKGNRYFSKADIENIRLIYHLVKEKGFTLDGAKVYLKTNEKQILSKLEIRTKLEEIKAELEAIKNQL